MRFLSGRLLSSSVVVYFACVLIAFFINSWARSRKESVFHPESMSSTSCNRRLSTCVFACQLSRLLHAGLTIRFVKRCCTISRTSFTSSAHTPHSFMIFIPPSFCGKTPLGLRLIFACVWLLMSYHRTPCRLTSHCLSQLGTSREFLSVQSTLPTLLGSVRIS